MSISKTGVILMICLGLVGVIGYRQQGARSWTETNDLTGEYRVCQNLQVPLRWSAMRGIQSN